MYIMKNKTILSSILLSGLFFCTTSRCALHAAATEDAVVNTEKPDNHNMTPEAKQAHKEEKQAHKEERRARKAAHHKS